MIKVTITEGAVELALKVVPGASRTRLMGEIEGRLKVAVAAPPERGKANEALVEFLARRLGVRRQAVSVISGLTSPLKTVRVVGVSADDLLRRVST